MTPEKLSQKIKELEEARQKAVIFGEWGKFRKVKKKWRERNDNNN